MSNRVECPLCGKEVTASLGRIIRVGPRRGEPQYDTPVYARHRKGRSKLMWCLTTDEKVVAPADLAVRFDELAKIADDNAIYMRRQSNTPGFDPGIHYVELAKRQRETAEAIRMRERSKGVS